MNAKRLIALAVMVLVSGLGAVAQARQQNALNGTWNVTRADENGKAQADLKGATFTFKDDKLIMKLVNEKAPIEFSCKIDSTKTPKTIDIQPPDAKEAAVGIYELKGDTLKLCLADPGGKRPADFKSDAKGVVYIELTRGK